MNDEQKELARRLARCSQYKPEPVTADYTRRLCGTRVVRDVDGALIPDLTDAATGGVLLDMLGPGWGSTRDRRVADLPESFRVYPVGAGSAWSGDTLAEACARALLAKWGEA